MTKPYLDDLIATNDYTGFSAIYGDTITITNPGHHWDQLLEAYSMGRRARPVWGIAGADFHVEKKGVALDTFQTIFLAGDKTVSGVLEALKHGRVYAVRKAGDYRLSLDVFQVVDEETGQRALMGQTLDVSHSPVIQGSISASDGKDYRVKMLLIKSGVVWKTVDGKTPLDFHFIDKDSWTGKVFYRLEVQGPASQWLLSNPIFVSRS